MRRAEAEAAGFTIDDHCYPPVAYKGPRFDPDEMVRLEVSTATPLTTDHLRRIPDIIDNSRPGEAYALHNLAQCIDAEAEAVHDTIDIERVGR